MLSSNNVRLICTTISWILKRNIVNFWLHWRIIPRPSWMLMWEKLSEFRIDCRIGIIYHVSSPLNDVESVSNTRVKSSVLILNMLRQVKSFNVLSSKFLSILITFHYATVVFQITQAYPHTDTHWSKLSILRTRICV